MGARELGNPLGNPLGLSRKNTQSSALKDPVIFDFVTGTGDFIVPDGFSFARITAVGGGAGGTTNGGQGGGLSRSAIFPVKSGAIISYSCGVRGTANANALSILPANHGTQSVASCRDLQVVGPGGICGATVRNPGYGGVDNWSGAIPADAGGGASATPYGDGFNNGAIPTAVSVAQQYGGGGGGVFGPGGPVAHGSGINSTGYFAEGVFTPTWGGAGKRGYFDNGITEGRSGEGGLWGGGGGGGFGTGAPVAGRARAAGGHGGVRIELW